MSRITIIFFLVVTFSPIRSYAQKTFAWYEQQTYQMYMNEQWSLLIELGEEAIQQEFDYFYLRLRLGLASYNMGKYRSAIIHFNKALTYNSNDPVTIAYLYYAYVFAARMADANIIWGKYQELLKQRNIKSPNAFITGVYSEGGVKITEENVDGIGNLGYYHVGISQQLFSRLSIYQGYSYVVPTLIDAQYFTSTGNGPPRTYLQEVVITYPQNEYYVRAGVPIVRGLQTNFSYHLQVLHDSAGLKYRNQGYELGVKQASQITDIYLAYAGSYINNTNQSQFLGSVTFYPLSSNDLYLVGQYTYHLERGVDNQVFGVKIGGKLAPVMWLEGYGSYGGMNNFQEYEGFYMYNLPNSINYKWGVNAYFSLGSRTRLTAGYMLENKKTVSDVNQSFNQNYVFLGLTLNFKKR